MTWKLVRNWFKSCFLQFDFFFLFSFVISQFFCLHAPKIMTRLIVRVSEAEPCFTVHRNVFWWFYPIWNNKHLKKATKISVYRTVVLTTLLYGSESWVTYRHRLRLLESFHQRCLRSILNIHWSDYITNVEVLQQAGITSIEAMLMKTQLRWAGHVSRMEDHRLPKIVLYGELSTGHRVRGAPKKRYQDSLKKSLSTCHIDHRQWSALAADRGAWWHAVHQSVSSFESNRRATLEEKRSRRKNHVTTAPTPDSLQSLWPSVLVTNRPRQPPASLRQTWSTPLNLRSRSQAKKTVFRGCWIRIWMMQLVQPCGLWDIQDGRRNLNL